MSGDFDPKRDAEKLEKAIKGLGTDEEAIIEVLAKRTVKQRQEIAKTYKSMYDKDLITMLKKDLSGKFRMAVMLSFLDKPRLNSIALYHAMKGAGTKESLIIQILCTATNEEIAELHQAYEEVLVFKKENAMRRNLEKDIEADLSGDLEMFMVALLQGAREEGLDENTAKEDVKELLKAGEDRAGTDECVFTRIFARRSYENICKVDEIYKHEKGKSVLEAISSELSGDYEEAVLTVAKFALDKYGCLAEMFIKSMEGIGTDDEELVRLILAYLETDMPDIKRAFKDKSGKSLEDAVKADTSGDYGKFLLTLLENN